MSTWTPEMDEMLRAYWQQQLRTYEIAEIIGKSQKAVQGRAGRLGMFFERSKTRRKRPVIANGHVPADERSAELLRNAGVRI